MLLLACIDTGNWSALQIIKDVTILKVIKWIQISWPEVFGNTIKNFSQKCGFGKTDETVDYEFDQLLQELCSEATVKDFLEFEACVDTCEPVVNTLSADWKQEL